MTQSIAQKQIASARTLCDALESIAFSENIIYNPLMYARRAFEEYVTRYGNSTKRVVFLGMNPGPWGMAQTGVPFGEINTVRDWLSITAPIGVPETIHPKRPVLGYKCTRSEVSRERLWGLFKERYKQADAFFADHFVINYCPLLFIAPSGKDNNGARNITPDKLKTEEKTALYDACDGHLRDVIRALSPEFLVGVGNFAAERAADALSRDVKITKILHPSPANPRSNGGNWGKIAEQQLVEAGVWGSQYALLG